MSEAIQERAKRIYDKYGNVMLDVKGMTKAGVERKATCRALFSKLLYLAGAAMQCYMTDDICMPPAGLWSIPFMNWLVAMADVCNHGLTC